MGRLWIAFTKKYLNEEYMKKMEEEAMKILEEAFQTSIDPRAPDFIEGGTLGKTRRMALNILVDLDLIRKTSDSRDVFIITEEGLDVLNEWKLVQEKFRQEGEQQNLFPKS